MAREMGFRRMDDGPAAAHSKSLPPAAWKIVLATTVVGPVVGAGGLLILAAIVLVARSSVEASLQNVEWPIVYAVVAYVMVFGAITSLVSGLSVASVSRKRSWLRWHETAAIAAFSCITPLGLGLMSLPFTMPFSGLSLPILGFYAGIVMLPVAVASAVISRPIILRLVDWKRPATS